MKNIRLGISACLLGEPVRYDGGHKLDHYLKDTLGKYVEFVPVCPEVECGFGVPRETFRLVGNPANPRLVTTRTKRDFTERMEAWAKKRTAELEREELCGFVFKGGSPSSGMERVNVYDEKGVPTKKGVGLFARAFMERFPLTPVEEDGRLHDPVLRENFIERIFTCRRWCEAMEGKNKTRALLDFHTKNKLLIMSHSPKHLQRMGHLAAKVKELPSKDIMGQYRVLLMEAMSLNATPSKNANVLMHMMGYFKKEIAAAEKQELLELIDEYRRGIIPLIVPVTLINHYVRKYSPPYLNSHPLELQLRNRV